VNTLIVGRLNNKADIKEVKISDKTKINDFASVIVFKQKPTGDETL
jgi:hypothetical protein